MVGSGTVAMHCLTARGPRAMQIVQCMVSLLGAWGKWVVELLQCTASLPGVSRQWKLCNVRKCKWCNALPHYFG